MSHDIEQGVKGVLALNDPRERARLWELPDRRVVMALSTGVGMAFVTLLTLIFMGLGVGQPPAAAHGRGPATGQTKDAAKAPEQGGAPPPGTSRRSSQPQGQPPDATGKAGADKPAAHTGGMSAERLSIMLLDYPSKHFIYPLTIQNFMYVLFFIGCGELFVRWRIAVRELGFLQRRLLPEDEETVLQYPDLGPIRRQVAKAFDGEHGFLPSLIDLSVLQFQASRSVDQTVAVMNHALELIAHRVDLRYGLIRFIAWMVPTVGFIGTVYGLGASLYEAGAQAEINVQETARTLGVGFDCTMVALMQSAVLVFAMHLVQEKEEMSVNLAGGYCLRNLINRLYSER